MSDSPALNAGERLARYGDRYLIRSGDRLCVAARDDEGWRRANLCVEERAAIMAAWAETKAGEPVFIYGFNFAIGGATRSAVKVTVAGAVNIAGPVFFDVATGAQTPIDKAHPALCHGIRLGPLSDPAPAGA